MHKRIITCFVVLMIVTFHGMGDATLINYGDVVIDDVSGLTWIRDLSLLVNMTYAEQQAALGRSTAGGLTDWHIASHDEITSLWSYDADEIVDAFLPTWLDTDGHGFYCGRGTQLAIGQPDPDDPWRYVHTVAYIPSLGEYGKILGDEAQDSVRFEGLSAWAVTDRAPIPEPATMLLLGSGLIGMFGFKKKKNKS